MVSYFSRKIGPRNENSLAYISVEFGGIDLKLCMRVFVDIAY